MQVPSTRSASPRRSAAGGTRPRSVGPTGSAAPSQRPSPMASSPATATAGWERAIEPGRGDGRLVATSLEPEQPGESVRIPTWLSADLVAALTGAGIEGLYSHQLEALEAAAAGNVIVTSGTASGKSLAFNLPV